MLFDPASTRALTLKAANGGDLAVEITEGQGPTFVWLGGYGTDMNGSKATYVKGQCEAWSYRLVRFDYRGCGASPGDMGQMTLTDYLADAEAVLKQATDGPVILIGSSMGGWLSLRLIQKYPDRVLGFIGIASIADFTVDAVAGTPAGPPGAAPLSQAMIDDGNANHLVMKSPIKYDGFAALLQGQRDDAVPWKTALDIANILTTDHASVHLVKDADHRFAREEDLELLWQVMNSVREKIIGPVQPMPQENPDFDITI